MNPDRAAYCSSVFQRLHPLFLAFLHAALFALSFPPFDLWPLAFIAVAPLGLLAVRAQSTRGMLLSVLVTQFAMWLWLLHWIIPVTAVGYPFLALYLSVWPAMFAWIIRRISRQRQLSRRRMTIVVPVVWVGVEFFRGDVLFHGYPWYLLGHPLIAAPVLVQSADLAGTYFISFLTAMVSGVIVDGFMLSGQREIARRAVVTASVVAGIWIANLIYGAWRMDQNLPLTPGPRILAIQTNLPQDNKVGWSEEEQARDVPQFIEMTRAAAAQSTQPPDLIAWPETMVPGLGFDPQTLNHLHLFGEPTAHLTRWPEAVQSLSNEMQVPFLVGSEAWVNTSIEEDADRRTATLRRERTYNSAFLVQGDSPPQRYDKFFLTPFGETMPYISAWPWLEQQLLALGAQGMQFNLDSNPDIAILTLHSPRMNQSYRLATPICFEDTVARFCRRMIYVDGVKRADMFMNLSNDGWFNTSDADRKLHAQIARFRCIENRVPMVRSVNTGMSLSIDSAGRLIGSVNGGGYGQPRQAGWLWAEVTLDSRQTLYGKIGELFPALCLIATILMLGWTFLSRGHRSNAERRA